MKIRETITTLGRKKHEHKGFVAHHYCGICGQCLIELREMEQEVCSCHQVLKPEMNYCPMCGEVTDEVAQHRFLFLGVVLSEQDYSRVKQHLEGKAYTIKRTVDKGWRIQFENGLTLEDDMVTRAQDSQITLKFGKGGQP